MLCILGDKGINYVVAYPATFWQRKQNSKNVKVVEQ